VTLIRIYPVEPSDPESGLAWMCSGRRSAMRRTCCKTLVRTSPLMLCGQRPGLLPDRTEVGATRDSGTCRDRCIIRAMYSFPTHRLSALRDSHRTPIVLVACGSFSPLTYLHLRMFEMAKDYVRRNTDFEIVGGYLSPVSDQYKKPGLASAQHRCVQYLCCLCCSPVDDR
jgi:hypothetical protein